MNRRVLTGLTLALLATFALSACGKDEKKKGSSEMATVPGVKIVLNNAWARATAPDQTMSAGFLNMKSQEGDDALLSVTSDASETVELHKMVHEGDMMKMRMVESIELPENEVVKLEPGGLHIMFIGIKKPYNEGDNIQVTLKFKSGETMSLPLPVKKMEMPMGH